MALLYWWSQRRRPITKQFSNPNFSIRRAVGHARILATKFIGEKTILGNFWRGFFDCGLVIRSRFFRQFYSLFFFFRFSSHWIVCSVVHLLHCSFYFNFLNLVNLELETVLITLWNSVEIVRKWRVLRNSRRNLLHCLMLKRGFRWTPLWTRLILIR